MCLPLACPTFASAEEHTLMVKRLEDVEMQQSNVQRTRGGLALIGSGSRVAGVGHFVGHFLEMMLAMMFGMAVLTWPTRAALGMVGIPEPVLRGPVAYVLIMAFAMTVPMAVWMRFRGMEWHPIAEMSGAMFAEALLLIGASWLGILPEGSLVRLQHMLMMPAMLLPMLYRLDLYTGRAGHHAHTA